MFFRFFSSGLILAFFSSISMLAGAQSCDFTGNWRNVTAGGNFQLSQSGNMISFMYHNSGFNHHGSGTYNPDDNSFLIRQNRIDKATGCKTQGNLTYKVINCNNLVLKATWDGGCGIPPGHSEGPYTCVRE